MTRLLIADDNAGMQDVIVKAARRVGFKEHEIEVAKSEEEAYEKISNGEYQLAVIDLMFTQDPPYRFEGLGVIEELHRLQPECKIIALSAKVENEGGRKALDAGADDYVSTLWEQINWVYLLEVRLEIWRSLVEGAAAGLV